MLRSLTFELRRDYTFSLKNHFTSSEVMTRAIVCVGYNINAIGLHVSSCLQIYSCFSFPIASVSPHTPLPLPLPLFPTPLLETLALFYYQPNPLFSEVFNGLAPFPLVLVMVIFIKLLFSVGNDPFDPFNPVKAIPLLTSIRLPFKLLVLGSKPPV